jgi:PAS domain S-box-containing protein
MASSATADRLADLEREVAELRARLASAEAQIRPVVDSGVIGVVVCDRDGRLREANDAFLWMVGHTRDVLESGAVTWLDLVQPEHRARQERTIAQVVRTGRSGLVNEHLVRRDGSRVPVLILGMTALDADASRWSAAFLPLIERESAADALRATEARLAGIVGTAMDAIVTIDSALRVVVFNAAAERMFGCSAASIVGRSVLQLVPERYHEAVANGIRDFGNAETPARAAAPLRTLVAHRADGSEFPFEATISRADVAGQRLFTVILRDATERLRHEEERATLLARTESARAEAEGASKTKDEFLATLSHELRTPLTAMLTWTHLLRSRRLDATNEGRAVETLERCTLAMARMIDDLLDVSRIVTGKLAIERGTVDLAAVARVALESVRLTAEERAIALSADLGERLGTVSGDAVRLQQIVTNLLSNAVKFTRRGGRVHLALSCAGGAAHIAVSDTGQGISPEFLPHVFERFRQANRSTTRLHGGLGLGLAIVEHLVERHGGTVTAASEGPGKGATFTVTLPLATADVHAPALDAAAPGDETGEHLAGVRVLLVDDHDDARCSIATALEADGATVVAVPSVAAALRAFGRETFDVLVSDIALPVEDGYSLIRKLRAGPPAGRTLVAAALTAYAGPEDRERVLAAGFDEHLPKPIPPAALVRTLRNLLDHRRRDRHNGNGASSREVTEEAGEPAATQGGRVDAADSPSKPRGSVAAMARTRPSRSV